MPLTRDALLEAFDDIGVKAISTGERLELIVYGGSALLLGSNFRFSTEDVDVSDITTNQLVKRPNHTHRQSEQLGA